MGWFRQRQSRLPVVVIGNLSVGGSGKTPMVIWLAKWLQAKDIKPGVILRGYRGTSPTWPVSVDVSASVESVGDEAILLANELKVPVVAGPDRFENCQVLERMGDVDVVISDDGLQHLSLARDFEILLLNSSSLGNKFCLPAGPLRESLRRKKTVDICVHYNAPDELLNVTPVLGEFCSLSSNVKLTATAFVEKAKSEQWSVAIVTAIAQPERFVNQIQDLSIECDNFLFPDHHFFVPEDFSAISSDIILMTGKDAVKCVALADHRFWKVELTLVASPGLESKLETELLPLLKHK
ncbi:MAG: tetraacyldisaccharide 4'-kinase [Gammaproteobacteria bacterium]|jgi:tetraacyldisaccharide 4'-kinase